jgi:hypothetical protein
MDLVKRLRAQRRERADEHAAIARAAKQIAGVEDGPPPDERGVVGAGFDEFQSP